MFYREKTEKLREINREIEGIKPKENQEIEGNKPRN